MPTPTPTPPPPILDHYTVYLATGPDGPSVNLVDQFQTQTVDLGSVVAFAPPADKNTEGVLNPFDHLTCYDIPVGNFDASVDVFNQFGPQTLTVGDPDMLCVPTEKFPGPSPAPLTLDHYKCYGASGPSVNVPATLTDQFQGRGSRTPTIT